MNEILLRAEVTADQIDHLGHMNVRFYGQHARTGAGTLAAALGLHDEGDVVPLQRDIYTRHHHEQLLGARLVVRGGVLEAGPRQVRVYQELVNDETGELAATFVTGLGLCDRATRDEVDLPDAVITGAAERLVTLPDHGRPRSIDLDGDPAHGAPTMSTVRERDLALREVRKVTSPECAPDGLLLPELLVDLVWGGVALAGREFRPFHDAADGTTLGWATMETRATWARVPRVGDRVQSFGAEMEIGAKTTRSRHWVFDVDRQDLVCSFSVVNLAFDVEARRSMPIPDDLRTSVSQRLHPDLEHQL